MRCFMELLLQLLLLRKQRLTSTIKAFLILTDMVSLPKGVILQEGSISFHLVKMIGETVLRSCIFRGMLVVDLE